MRIHSLHHAWFEDLAGIEAWAHSRNHPVRKTFLSNHESLPALDEFDWLVVMGGPMNIYEEDQFPWLAPEKKLIRQAIQKGKTVLGVCLGAQLIADALGGRVCANPEKEIGWFPVSLTAEAIGKSILGALPREFVAFHWHGDTFEIPAGCRRIAQSEACQNQAFEYDDGRVVALQFHLESSRESVRLLIENCGNELGGSNKTNHCHPREGGDPPNGFPTKAFGNDSLLGDPRPLGKFIQSLEKIEQGCEDFSGLQSQLELLLDRMAQKAGKVSLCPSR